MTASIFARTLASAAMVEVFADRSIVAAMLAFEAALAEAEAAEGVIPASAVAPIVAASRAGIGRRRCARRRGAPCRQPRDPARQAADRRGRRARRARRRRSSITAARARTCIDTAMVIVNAAGARADRRRSRAPRRRRCDALARAHLRDADAGAHADAAGAGDQLRLQDRRLGWRRSRARASALRVRGRRRCGCSSAARSARSRALGDKGPAVARRLAARLGLAPADGAWHVQRDDWVALGCEVAVLCGSLGKIGHDLALLAQAEVGEVAEPSARGTRRLVGDAAEEEPGRGDDRDRRRPARAASRRGAAGGDGAMRTSAASATGRPSWPNGRRCSSRRTARSSRSPTPAPGSRSTPRACATTSSASTARCSQKPPPRCSCRRSARRRRTRCWRRLSSRAAREGAQLHALLRADPAARAIDAAALDAAFDVDAAARRAGALAAGPARPPRAFAALNELPMTHEHQPPRPPRRLRSRRRQPPRRPRRRVGRSLARRRERVQRRLPEPDHALRLERHLGPPRPRPRDAAPARARHDDGHGALGGVRAALPRRDRAAACRSSKIKETLLQGAIYCGVPAANTAFKITGEILRAEGRAPAPRSLAADSRIGDAPHVQRAAAARRRARAGPDRSS